MKRLVQFMLWVTTFAVWKPWGYDGILLPKELAFMGLSILAISSFLIKPHLIQRIGLGPIGLFPFLFVLGFYRTGAEPVAIKMFLCTILGTLLIWILANSWTVTDFRPIFRTAAWVGFSQAAFGLLQALHDPFFHPVDLFLREGYQPLLRDRIFGFFASPSHFACFLTLCLPACLFLKRRWQRLLTVSTIVVSTVLTHKSTALAILFAYILYFVWSRRGRLERYAIALFLLVMFSIVKFGTGGLDFGKREVIWSRTLEDTLRRPLFGHGWGVFGNTVNFITTESGGFKTRWLHPHNELLAVGYASGLTGLTLLTFILLWFSWRLIYQVNLVKLWPKELDTILCGFIAMAGYSMTSFPFHIAPTALLAIIYTAAFLSATDFAWKHSLIVIDRKILETTNKIVEEAHAA